MQWGIEKHRIRSAHSFHCCAAIGRQISTMTDRELPKLRHVCVTHSLLRTADDSILETSHTEFSVSLTFHIIVVLAAKITKITCLSRTTKAVDDSITSAIWTTTQYTPHTLQSTTVKPHVNCSANQTMAPPPLIFLSEPAKAVDYWGHAGASNQGSVRPGGQLGAWWSTGQLERAERGEGWEASWGSSTPMWSVGRWEPEDPSSKLLSSSEDQFEGRVLSGFVYIWLIHDLKGTWEETREERRGSGRGERRASTSSGDSGRRSTSNKKIHKHDKQITKWERGTEKKHF